MPDTRFHLKHGDPTSTGGQLIAIRPDFTHHGVAMAIEGDVATCPACKSSGPVLNDCYPGDDYHGTQVLVTGARVYCKCQEHPIVLNTQRDSSVEISWSNSRNLPRGLSSSSLRDGELANYDTQVIEQHFALVDAETGVPETGYRYDLFVGEQRISEDVQFLGGETAKVHGGESASIVMWLDKPMDAQP